MNCSCGIIRCGGHKPGDCKSVAVCSIRFFSVTHFLCKSCYENARRVLRSQDWQWVGALTLLLLTLAPLPVRAQTISPVVTEYGGGKKASGNFTIRNNGLTPITVIVEPPQSLTFANGKPQLRPLEPGVHLELSEQSAKIGARQSHQFDFRLTCDVKPCALTIYSAITGPHANGLALAIHLPYTIYYCQKAKGCRASVIKGGKP